MENYILLPIYGVVAGLLASIPLGPIGVLCIQRTLSCSRRSGFVSGLGAATADTTFAALAIFALTWITGFISTYQMWVEALGGLLIVGFGFSIFFKKAHDPAEVAAERPKGRQIANFLSVLFLTLPNPAYFLVFVTIFAAMGVGEADATLTEKLLIISGVLAGATSWWFFLTWIVSIFRKKFTLRSMVLLNKISGGAIVLLGAYAVLRIVWQLITQLIKTNTL